MTRGIDQSPTGEVLVEESVIGWKEFEMEVVRDRNDNCIIICSIENFDPMGIHTGDSITVAPAQTLTDKEYQRMRDASIAVLRKIGVDTGGSNVQFALEPDDGRLLVIEMNPRVSRSSALASKATGFPIAKVAAKLAIGYTLDELKNEITGGATPASFEPTIDYVVTKIPRFTFEKFPQAADAPDDADEVGRRGDGDRPHVPGVAAEGAARTRDRRRRAQPDARAPLDGEEDWAQARATSCKMPGSRPHLVRRRRIPRRPGRSTRSHELTNIDPWFLAQIEDLVAIEKRIAEEGRRRLDGDRAARAQAQGILAIAASRPARHQGEAACAQRVTTRTCARSTSASTRCAAEFATSTAYLYSTYEEECEAEPTDRKQDHDPRRRPEPHRPGHRVRLLLRARGARAARRRVRDHHGQLQPGDRLHRLRHLGSPVLRAAHARRRAGDHRTRRSRRA